MADSSTTIFQLIKQVLDSLYSQIDDPQKDMLIKQKLTYLSGEYSQLMDCEHREGMQPIDYADPATRFAYVFRYVTLHANMVFQFIENHEGINSVFDENRTLKLTCIGGGPGSEIIGVLKYMLQGEKTNKLHCCLCDRDNTWVEPWQTIDEIFDLPFSTNVFTQTFDVTERRTWSRFHNYLDGDIFAMVYFLSEIFCHQDEARPFFENLLQKAKRGAWFLFIDNNDTRISDWFDELMKSCDFDEPQNFAGQTHILDYGEEKSDLGEYLAKFGSPRLRANIAIRIFRKSVL